MLNIFNSIHEATRRREPFHSQFLADALHDSVNGERSLFEEFWRLATPDGWKPPERPLVDAEHRFDDGRRIDICIVDNAGPKKRVLGVEVKTSSASAQRDQLEAYRLGLIKNHPRADIAIAYLTPFNREKAGESAERFPEVTVFDEFAENFEQARHLSWLEIAEIDWDGRDIWRQHQAYVIKTIAPKCELEPHALHNQSFYEFFGTDLAGRFFEALQEMGVETGVTGAEIDLKRLGADPNSFTRVFEVHIYDGVGVAKSEKSDRFTDDLRERFIESDYGEFHRALFNLSRRFGNVWVSGAKDYAIRVAHKRYGNGVSLVRSRDSATLETGRPRRARAS